MNRSRGQCYVISARVKASAEVLTVEKFASDAVRDTLLMKNELLTSAKGRPNGVSGGKKG